VSGPLELTVVIPCLNEERTVGACVDKVVRFLADHGVRGEVVVADNGSTDDSREIARRHGARVVIAKARGYGSALRAGIDAARGDLVIMGDADGSYDFSSLMPFVEKLRQGFDLVLGNRFQGGIRAGAMRPLHRWLGNPVLSFLGRTFFGTPLGDFHCGLRGFRRHAYQRMNLRTTGMEFASEMIVKATLFGMRITEVPTVLHRDGRDRPSHLRSWRDGWRHLRFLLLYSPRWLFLVPGIVLAGIGTAVLLWLWSGARQVGAVILDVHTMLYAAAAIVVGCQSISFAIFAKAFAIREGLLPDDQRLAGLERVPFETGVVLGIALFLAGVAGSVLAVMRWSTASFGDLEPREVLRIVIPSVLALTLGGQLVLTSFMLEVLSLGKK
jgi:glycosyltransferase involved in cell wall biosynthesis